ncbi:MAG: acetate--CoA ligase family protein [Acidimicrobiia bacterium]|nr:acetate--CoA ligase family protein [Acidimicrobiia bacterium]
MSARHALDGRRTLSEAESKALLADYDVPCVPDRVVATAAAAVAAADELGYPVVAKLTGERIAHKTERGLVRLSLGGPEQVEAAAVDLLGAAAPDDGAVALLVAPMVRATRELIVGLHDDPQFGRCVMVGLGGVLAEAVADVAFRLAPIDVIDAHEMLHDLSAAAILGPVRGEPAVDRDAVVAVLLGLSRLATDRPDVASVDVNPLLIVDGAPIAVDALVEVRA